MSLFFVETKKKTPKKKRGQVSISTLHSLECKACPLNREKVYTPKMDPTGSDDPDIYILGEFPSEEEDQKSDHFVGKSGDILRLRLKKRNVKRSRFNNVVRTRSLDKKNPTYIEIECCRPSIIRDIEETKPKAIFGFGNLALTWVLGEGTITRWRGRKVPVKIGNHACWFFPFQDPKDLIKMRRSYPGSQTVYRSDKENIFESDIRYALGEVDVVSTPHVPDEKEIFEGIECVWGKNGDSDVRKITRYLKRFSEYPEVAVDYETCSKETIRDTYRLVRPFGEGTKILSVSISGYDETIAFSLDHPESRWTRKQKKEIIKAFTKFMVQTKTKKIAHNLPFELEWSIVKFGLDWLRDPHWEDTMAQAYLLDQRKGMLNLDVLTLINFGFSLKSYSNINVENLDLDPIEDVLLYNGGDAKWTFRLYHTQMIPIINRGLEKVYKEQVRRVASTVMMQYLGLTIDQIAIKKYQKDLSDEIDEIDDSIQMTTEVETYKKKYGSFNPASTKDCTILFKTQLKLETGKKDTATGYSTGSSVLEEVDLEIAQLILKRRELVKLKSTYVDSLSDVDGKFFWPDGLVHPTINTALTSTRRTSSDSPNEQNFPKKRNKDVRCVIVAPDGTIMFSVDYGQIEARVIGMASKDKNFCAALWEGYDVHMEWAEKIVYQYPRIIGGKRFLKDKEVMSNMRQNAKNLFVFPSFFGAQPPSIAEDLKIPLEDTQALLRDFWRTFSGVKSWQKQLKEDYKTYGYVELLTGFRRYGPLDGSQIINTPIQGTASDIVVDALNRLSEHAVEADQLERHPRLLVHDDLSFFLPKKKFDEYAAFIIDEMLKIKFSFINVPLTVEASCGPNWFDLKEIGTFSSNK